MPRVRRIRRHRTGVRWAGDCPRQDCDRGFSVDAEPWMQKTHVLLEVRDLERDWLRHLHGEHTITAYLERGGE